ncbi:hypothetical protein BH10ACT4_BH10ACT4_05000 [soil metagenome]
MSAGASGLPSPSQAVPDSPEDFGENAETLALERNLGLCCTPHQVDRPIIEPIDPR